MDRTGDDLFLGLYRLGTLAWAAARRDACFWPSLAFFQQHPVTANAAKGTIVQLSDLTTFRVAFSVFLVFASFGVMGCGKSSADAKSAGGPGGAANGGQTAAIAHDNPLVGAWTNKDTSALFSLPDREYTETEMISDGQHWPATYEVQGNTIRVAAEGLPPMTCVMVDDHTMHLTIGNFGGTMVRFVPLKWPGTDPADAILAAMHAGDLDTLMTFGNYKSGAQTDSAKAMIRQSTKDRMEQNELYSLLGHDCSWKVIATDAPTIDRLR